MRKTEIARLTTLREKIGQGIELKDKEIDRLKKLEKIEKEELEKDGGTRDKINTCYSVGHNSDSREISGTSEGDEHRNIDETTSNAQRVSGQVGGDDSEHDGEDRPVGINDRNVVGQGGEDRNDGGNGSPGGTTTSGRNNSDSGSRREEEGEIFQHEELDLKPKTVKPKRPKTKKTKDKSENTDLVKMLLQGAFGMVAQITKKSYWAIEEEEADSVAVPLTKMIEDMSPKQKKIMEKYTNPILLASALAGIVVPRVMISMSQKPNKRSGVNLNVKQQTESSSTRNVVSDISERKIPRESTAAAYNNSAYLPNATKEVSELFRSGGFGITSI